MVKPWVEAEQDRDQGIEDSATSAGVPWIEIALLCLQIVVQRHLQDRTFLCEDVREWIEKDGLVLDDPPTKKSWGAVMRLAQSRGVLASAGYARARSSNLSPKVLWRAV